MSTAGELLPGYNAQGPSSTTSVENLPPEYSITYTFSTVSANSMLLLPPSASPETRPRYHISVSQNCFTPMSWITTVRRGSSPDGEILGEFEMGILMGGIGSTGKRPTVFMHGRGPEEGEKWLEDIYNDNYAHHVTWQLPHRHGHLYWSILSSHKKCYCSNSLPPHPLLAEFIAQPPTSNSRLRPSMSSFLSSSYQPYQLKVYPHGFAYLDEILVSALVYERKRTTPSFQTVHVAPARTKYERYPGGAPSNTPPSNTHSNQTLSSLAAGSEAIHYL
ncbi:hypothetical protein GGU11DRAFT_797396 [Lentinula aff. detonsa]|nr:hypothetical protein GGU11DRAFT_797396 [Lentinula aff. detonsa]